jgi:hypothetical protein
MYSQLLLKLNRSAAIAETNDKNESFEIKSFESFDALIYMMSQTQNLEFEHQRFNLEKKILHVENCDRRLSENIEASAFITFIFFENVRIEKNCNSRGTLILLDLNLIIICQMFTNSFGRES